MAGVLERLAVPSVFQCRQDLMGGTGRLVPLARHAAPDSRPDIGAEPRSRICVRQCRRAHESRQQHRRRPNWRAARAALGYIGPVSQSLGRPGDQGRLETEEGHRDGLDKAGRASFSRQGSSAIVLLLPPRRDPQRSARRSAYRRRANRSGRGRGVIPRQQRHDLAIHRHRAEKHKIRRYAGSDRQ